MRYQGKEYRIVGSETVSNESPTPKGSDNTGGAGAANTGGGGVSGWFSEKWKSTKNFFSEANRSFGLYDMFMPSRGSFEGRVESKLFGGPCDYNCEGHNFYVKQTADVWQGGAQGVAEAGNRYYPELVKTTLFSALPLGGAAQEYITLYRAVSRAELDSMANLRKFAPGNGSMGNEWFAESAADAAAWGKKFFGFNKEAVFTIRVRGPNDLASKMMRDPKLDGIGPARSADAKLLDEINRRGRIDALNESVLK